MHVRDTTSDLDTPPLKDKDPKVTVPPGSVRRSLKDGMSPERLTEILFIVRETNKN